MNVRFYVIFMGYLKQNFSLVAKKTLSRINISYNAPAFNPRDWTISLFTLHHAFPVIHIIGITLIAINHLHAFLAGIIWQFPFTPITKLIVQADRFLNSARYND